MAFLVLTRRVGETIKIGDDREVTVSSIYGNRVRLTITAPRQVPIHRGEIYEQIKHGHTLVLPKKENKC